MNESFEHKGITVEIHADENPQSPREWETMGTMVCFHRRNSLGDDNHGYKSQDFNNFAELLKQIIKDHRPAAIVPLYLFDHSGITISSKPERFRRWDSHGWDWGQVGFVYVSREKALSEYGGEQITPFIKEQTLSVLLAEIETYDQYLRGEVYGYVIKDADGEHLDSCWGYYGIEECREEAKAAADCIAFKQTA